MELDLALDIANINPSRHDPGDLLDPNLWKRTMLVWLEHVRDKSDLECPTLVRWAKEISLGLRFTDDATICELNGKWRQRREPTDVLSFAALEDVPVWMNDDCVELGDIVISLDTARRQSLEQEHSLKRELRWLASHGLLHLLGWDHQDVASLKAMLAYQEQLLDIVEPFDSQDVGTIRSKMDN
ncbi:MAG: rRNA maturation RNase YbeY [Cyanobium sp. ARS6]|nr:rRNA maturation RNase YbeY [Cyanobium sp. ARS6]